MHDLPPSRGDGTLIASVSARGARGRVLALFLVAFAVVVLDVFTKELVLALLEPRRFVPVLGSGVGWQLVFNPGAAFGLRLPTIVFPLVTAVLAVVVVRSVHEGSDPLQVVAQALVLGGAVGNVLDRMFRPGDGSLFGGFVVDFVAWGTFPRFNVADASITVGVTLYIIAALLAERMERRPNPLGPDAS